MNTPTFFDVIGPTALVVFFIIFVWSLYWLKRKSLIAILIGTILNFGIASIFWWSIGKILVFVPLLQLIAAICILIKNGRNHLEK